MRAMFLCAFLLAIGMDLASLQKIAARFAPTEVSANLAGLPAQEKAALAKIVGAGPAAPVRAAEGPLVQPGPRRAVHPGRAVQARGRELLSPGGHQGGGRSL